jgi:hypothetical protein
MVQRVRFMRGRFTYGRFVQVAVLLTALRGNVVLYIVTVDFLRWLRAKSISRRDWEIWKKMSSKRIL